MVKLVFVLLARADIDPAEFHRYWLDEHAAKVRAVAEAIGAKRYVQSHTLLTPVNDLLTASRGAAAPFDGVAELWWDSLDDLQAALGTPEGVAAAEMLRADESMFIDFARSAIFMTEEHEVFDRSTEPRI